MLFFFSSRRRHTRLQGDWSSDVCSSDLVGTLLGLVAAGFLVGRNPAAVASNFTGFWRHAGWNFDSVRLVGVAMVGSLFSSDSWNNVTFTAGEVRNPKRNL